MEHIFMLKELCFKQMIEYPDINIEKDKTTFIIGPSGCGKSTLFKLLNGTVSQSIGEIFYNGKNISEIDTIVLRKEVLLIGQCVYLFDKSIRDNFSDFYGYRDLPMPDDETINSFLSLCCMEATPDAQCISMSGGEKQRVYIAICISFMPKVLMLDEPTSALDAQTAEKLLRNIKDFCINHGITLLIVSHDKAMADKFADYVIELERR